MTASAAEMRRWRCCTKKGKKESQVREREEWKGRLVSIRERENGGRYKQEGEGDGKARMPTHATFSRSFLRSFVRFFVMTVDETMTYFSGFYSRGAPRLCHSHLPSYLPPFLPFSPGTHARARRRLECILSSSFHCASKSCVFSFCVSRVILFVYLSRLTLSSAVIYM